MQYEEHVLSNPQKLHEGLMDMGMRGLIGQDAG
jgi:hypothetical protein